MKHSLYLAPFFARFIAHSVKAHYKHTPLPDCLIPVPAHPKRIRERGFNPALEIAKWVSRYLAIPLKPHLAKRTIHASPQSQLPFKARKKNVKAVFTCKGALPNSIVVLDDVMTTGATAQSLSETLKRAGVKYVAVWCIAKTTLESAL